MSSQAYFIFVLAVSLLLSTAYSAKILFLAHSIGKSHFNVFEPIIDAIARRNHDVTLHSYFNINANYPNVKWTGMRFPNMTFADSFNLEDEFQKGILQQNLAWVPMFLMTCPQLLTDSTTKELLNKGRQFDIVVMDSLPVECATVLSAMLGRHTVYLFTSQLFPWLSNSVPTPPSYVPNIVAPLTTKMSFCERMRNAYYALGMKLIERFIGLPQSQEIISKLLPEAPTIEEATKQVQFYITNVDPVMFASRPSMPHVAHCGAMHCQKAKPLPKDLEEFVQSSGNDGFILFGLGSGVRANMLKPEFIQVFVSAFSRLKQKVIWKFDADLENCPANVKTLSWMPQQDLLGHPKIRAFITHAGLLSLQEAIYHAVPVVPIPLFAEQPGNAARVKEIGIGVPLNFMTLTADEVYETVNKVVNDKRYSENMKKYSSILKDQQEKPVDRAVFWLEYLIRHDGAEHLRSAGEDLNFFQYFLLDVIGFVLLVAGTGVGIIVYLIKLTLRKFCCKKQSKKVSEKKTN